MTRSIDADALKTRIKEGIDYIGGADIDDAYYNGEKSALNAVINMINSTPTIEAEPEGYKTGEYDVLDLLSSAWHGKQYYFKQANGLIYSRATCQYMTLDDALVEFANSLGDDVSI